MIHFQLLENTLLNLYNYPSNYLSWVHSWQINKFIFCSCWRHRILSKRAPSWFCHVKTWTWYSSHSDIKCQSETWMWSVCLCDPAVSAGLSSSLWAWHLWVFGSGLPIFKTRKNRMRPYHNGWAETEWMWLRNDCWWNAWALKDDLVFSILSAWENDDIVNWARDDRNCSRLGGGRVINSVFDMLN